MRIPVRLKFSILIFLLIFVITGVTFWFTLDRVRTALTGEIRLQGELVAQILTLNAENPLISNDDLYLTSLVTDAVKNEGVVFACIVDNNDIIRAHNDIDFVGKLLSVFSIPEGLYTVTLPILVAGKKELGRVFVGIDTTRITTITRNMQIVLIVISIVGLVVGILGTLLLSNYLTSPIHELVKGVEAIAKGDLAQQITKRSDDEIGDLTASFNQMAQSLYEKEQIKDAFRRYVSHQVAEEIFKNPSQYFETLKGTRRKVTVFFADIRGFTPMVERLPADEVIAFLNDVLTSMTDVIFAHEGTIDKFLGDGLMAIFGAPITHPDDPDRAVQAAIDIQRSIESMNCERTKQGKEAIHVGIGIHTGEVVVGNIGTKDRLDYTVIGDSVNLASRLQSVASGGEIIVSEQAFQECSLECKFSEPMLIKVKGKEEPQKIYRIYH
jgi:adenylate cyclase